MTSRLAVVGRIAKREDWTVKRLYKRRCDTVAESDVYEWLVYSLLSVIESAVWDLQDMAVYTVSQKSYHLLTLCNFVKS